MPDLPEELQAHLARCYDDAASMGLDPSWHDDEKGFDFDCLSCREAGREHRNAYRFVPQLVLVSGPYDNATGPAA
jgi:hypothetical protein